MPSDPATALRDIEEHVQLAQLWTSDHSAETFREDRNTFYTVTRYLSIISEATRRLPPETLARHPALPWHQIKAACNLYRHQYEDVLEKDVWDTVRLHLPALPAFVVAER